MSRSAVELDFFRMEKETTPLAIAPSNKRFERRRSFRDIQSVICKINPAVVKAIIASGSVVNAKTPMDDAKSFSVPSSPRDHHQKSFLPPLPVYTPTYGPNFGYENVAETAPLTIFYNGTVAVFDVPRHQAENILKLAEDGSFSSVESNTEIKPGKGTSPNELKEQRKLFAEKFNGNLPLARRESLKRFLEKRKQRLSMGSPYGCPTSA